MRKVKVSNRPDEEIEVSEAEYLDLVRQGLVEAQEDENRKDSPKPTRTTTHGTEK